MPVVAGHGHGGDHGALPQLLAIDLGYRHVELVPQALLEALHDVALVLEGVGVVQPASPG